MARSLLALTNTEKFHFRSVSGALLLVFLLVTTLYFYQNSINEDFSKVAGLQQQNTITNDKLMAMNEKLEGDIKKTNSKLLDLNDQTDSLDGRLNRVSPFSQFGRDNIIHGPQWLAGQPSNMLVIQLSMVSDKKALYEIAQRYSYHLKQQQMAYYAVKTVQGDKYVLTYGSFASNAEVSAVLYRLPYYMNRQRPNVVAMTEVQRLISL